MKKAMLPHITIDPTPLVAPFPMQSCRAPGISGYSPNCTRCPPPGAAGADAGRLKRETGEPLYAPLATDGASGSYEWDSRQGDEFVQAGALYRVMDEAARARLIANIAGSLSQVSKDEIVERSVAHFRAADAEYGERIATAVAHLREDLVVRG